MTIEAVGQEVVGQTALETEAVTDCAARKPWQTPVVIAPARVASDTGYLPGGAGDSYSFFNVHS